MSESMPHTLAEKHPLSNDDATVPSDGVSVLNGEVIAPFEREAKVHFSLWHTLGISFSITAAPISMGAYLALAIGVGGPPVYFGAYIFSVGLNMFVCVSLAEMASAFPHSSGNNSPVPQDIGSKLIKDFAQVIFIGLLSLLPRR